MTYPLQIPRPHSLRGVSAWPAVNANRVIRAPQRIGWSIKRQVGYHRVLAREGWEDYVFSFHDGDEIGPVMLARIAKHTGPRTEDL
jgi:predicted RNA binding protein YcfA (HicA-like mRNA interferase family)